MNFNRTVLALEMENLHRRENEMFRFYSDLHGKLRDPEIKEVIKKIRDQELGHIQMVQTIITMLKDYILQG